MNMSLICNSSCSNLAGLQSCQIWLTSQNGAVKGMRRLYLCSWMTEIYWNKCQALQTYKPAPLSAQRALLAIEKAKIEYLCCSSACQHKTVKVHQLHVDLSKDK